MKFSCHLHVARYKTENIMPLNMQLNVMPNILGLDILFTFPFPNTLSLQFSPVRYCALWPQKRVNNTPVNISISTFPKSSSEWKAVRICHSKYYHKQSPLTFLMIESAFLSTIPK